MHLLSWTMILTGLALLLGNTVNAQNWSFAAFIAPFTLLAVIRTAQILSVKDIEILAKEHKAKQSRAKPDSSTR